MSRSFFLVLSLASSLVSPLTAGCGSCGRERASGTDSGVTPRSGDPRARTGGGSEPEEAATRLVILGFDGVDPEWLDRYVAEGKLPNLARLTKAHGGRAYRHLGSTNPPQSPVAWTSFATGTWPGDHGIFDFIGRKLNTAQGGLAVMPTVATTSFEVHRVGPPVARNLRTGEPFWKTLADDGIEVVAINVPYSFPPDPMREGRMLSGLGVPDLRETNSTFVYVGTDVTEEMAQRPPGGGALVPLTMRGSTGRFDLEGPSIPGGEGRRMTLPIEVRSGAPEGGLTVVVGGREVALALREPSDWVELTFDHDGSQVRGIARFTALEAGARTRLFVSPISFHPRAPYSPITYPSRFSAQIADAIGSLYKTVGWDHDTSALNAEVIDEELFLADMDSVEGDRQRMLRAALDEGDFRMLIWVSTATDRVAHMFHRLIDPEHPRYDAELAQRFGDAIERQYRRMDETVGIALGKLREGDTLLILSDHGFHNYRWGLHVNQWLRQNDFLALKDDAASSPREFLLDVDWSRTKAYALGTGQIYLNMRGRERDGIVSRDQAPEVLRQIRDGLLALRDEAHGGGRVVRQVYIGTEVFQGQRAADAPDAQIAFEENYRTSWETILGGVPEGLIADNDKKWSGDHAASDVADTAGIIISNRPLRDRPTIVDIAPTALTFFEREVPGRYAGRSLF